MAEDLVGWCAAAYPEMRAGGGAAGERPGAASALLELRGPDGTRWFAKRHASRKGYERELAAYRNWVPAIAARAPRLIRADDATATLVLTAVPGVLGDEAALPPAAERAMHREAGALLRAFHGAAPAVPASGFADGIARHFDRLRARAAGLVSARELGFVADCVAALADGPEPELTPCHRDYTARNWLVDAGRVSVIDFEHARIDARVWDFLRLCHQRWPGRQDLREAFLAGYGRELTEAEDTLILRCGAYNALATVLWAREAGDRGFERTGRASLALLQGPARP